MPSPSQPPPPNRPKGPESPGVRIAEDDAPGEWAFVNETKGLDRVSDRPTLMPSVAPEIHAARAMRAAESLGTSERESRPSQIPTLEPPDEDRKTIERVPTGWSLAPAANSEQALEFVDAHARESLVPLALTALESPARQQHPAPDPGASLSDMFAVGNFSGAMAEAENRLRVNPDDEEALRYADECRLTLTRMFTARLGSLLQRVRIDVPFEEIRWMNLDHRAGFLLSLVDGNSSIDDLLDVSSMPRLDALRILVELHSRGVIALDPP